MYIYKKENMKVPLKVFSKEGSIEPQCLEQMEGVSSLPFLHKHVALMPDGHLGMGASIGAVVATSNVIVPSLIGVDIGCGICAVKINQKRESSEHLKNILSEIRKAIPVGFNKHKEKQFNFEYFTQARQGGRLPLVCAREANNAEISLGTLGGGNHFIEIQKESDGFRDDGHLWIMIHSGSRNLGKQVAEHYNKIAKQLNKRWYTSIMAEKNLAFLPIETDECQDYLREMQYCLEFALANRKLMMKRILKIFGYEDDYIQYVLETNMINIHHNYASLENHYGKNVWVHRKGATSAREGEIGIIPGSQGTSSYIVKGKGNKESFMSCSHGAGRTMSRTKAISNLDLEKEKKAMDDKGILHTIRGKINLDEAPGSYKNIDTVMDEQKDLVDIVTRLSPLATIKG